jgi:hypothetical protein
VAAAEVRPARLPERIAREVAEAIGALQLSDTRVWLVGEPPLLGGGGTDLSRW